jgi:hypothetical protein
MACRMSPLTSLTLCTDTSVTKTYEVLSGPSSAPTVAVPTHFAKVILASRTPASAGGLSLVSGNNREWSLGAFVLPNEVISDQKPLLDFVVPGASFSSSSRAALTEACTTVDAVESSAGLTLFPDSIKAMSRPLCQVRTLLPHPDARLTQLLRRPSVNSSYDDSTTRRRRSETEGTREGRKTDEPPYKDPTNCNRHCTIPPQSSVKIHTALHLAQPRADQTSAFSSPALYS